MTKRRPTSLSQPQSNQFLPTTEENGYRRKNFQLCLQVIPHALEKKLVPMERILGESLGFISLRRLSSLW